MDAFDLEYWNLCQAAVWIEFREKDLVRQFAAPEGQMPDPVDYRALHFYPSMWPPERVVHGKLNELHDSLRSNLLTALGYHVSKPDVLQVIPPALWADIDLRPPFARDARDRRRELWSLVRVKRSDILRRWPFPSDEHDRSWFDWTAVRQLYDEVRTERPNLSENQTILEIQARFQKRHKKKPPGRTALQNRIKEWKIVAT
jgi:hypothetical protein